ncbi:MAG: aminoglycoside phosphotransferase family protein [Thermodesulfobacteriota bacterium]|nr:aminoglycoside phosphotransferase family protein [Thermodesulfobacteriota bacterium]
MTADTQKALFFFLPEIKITSLEPLGDGNVNDTWLIVSVPGEKYVLQRLNPFVFPDPGLVQDNLCTVTYHLQARLNQIDADFTVLKVIDNGNGAHSYIAHDGACWRMLSYIDDTQSLNTVSTADQAREIGRTLGLFHQLTSSLPPSSLADPLPGFHNTPLYLKQYDALLPTAQECAADCRDFIDERRHDVSLLEDLQKQETVRQQVIHGDPKVANFLFSRDLKRVISLIDLDTVKPGLLLHDIGDCLRSCCNPSGEDVREPGDVVFDQDLFAAMLSGYFNNASDLLTVTDKQLLVDSVRLISFELGLRFYSDHLAGNRYFKVKSPKQNLFRARVQFALVRSIESKYTELMEICGAVHNKFV